MALTAIESTVDASIGFSRTSFVSNERPPLLPDDAAADDVSQAAAALRASMAVDQSLQEGKFLPAAAESPRITAGRGRLGPSEPGLADMAESLAGATGLILSLHSRAVTSMVHLTFHSLLRPASSLQRMQAACFRMILGRVVRSFSGQI